jgi:hypothetical protein
VPKVRHKQGYVLAPRQRQVCKLSRDASEAAGDRVTNSVLILRRCVCVSVCVSVSVRVSIGMCIRVCARVSLRACACAFTFVRACKSVWAVASELVSSTEMRLYVLSHLPGEQKQIAETKERVPLAKL